LSKFFLVVVLGGCLAGCAFFQRQPEQLSSLSGSEQALYALKAWRLEGRVGVQTAKDAWHANLFWEHEADQDRLRISGPLNQGMLSIVVQKDLIYLNEGNGIGEMSRDPEALLKRRLGFAVPLSSLRYWILGLPDPAIAFVPSYDEKGGLTGFRQLGWLLGLDRFMKVGARVLPQKMLIQGSEVKLKLIADSWEIRG
jgi:outer membrane lipoprotein LolB